MIFGESLTKAPKMKGNKLKAINRIMMAAFALVLSLPVAGIGKAEAAAPNNLAYPAAYKCVAWTGGSYGSGSPYWKVRYFTLNGYVNYPMPNNPRTLHKQILNGSNGYMGGWDIGAAYVQNTPTLHHWSGSPGSPGAPAIEPMKAQDWAPDINDASWYLGYDERTSWIATSAKCMTDPVYWNNYFGFGFQP